jgi:hypothetical protein
LSDFWERSITDVGPAARTGRFPVDSHAAVLSPTTPVLPAVCAP